MGLIYCGLIWQWGPCCPLPPHPHFPKSANQVSLLLAPKSQPLLLALKESSPGSHRIVKRGKKKNWLLPEGEAKAQAHLPWNTSPYLGDTCLECVKLDSWAKCKDRISKCNRTSHRSAGSGKGQFTLAADSAFFPLPLMICSLSSFHVSFLPSSLLFLLSSVFLIHFVCFVWVLFVIFFECQKDIKTLLKHR